MPFLLLSWFTSVLKGYSDPMNGRLKSHGWSAERLLSRFLGLGRWLFQTSLLSSSSTQGTVALYYQQCSCPFEDKLSKCPSLMAEKEDAEMASE